MRVKVTGSINIVLTSVDKEQLLDVILTCQQRTWEHARGNDGVTNGDVYREARDTCFEKIAEYLCLEVEDG